MHSKIADGSQVRQINRAAILDLIRNQGSISRTRIASVLGISLSTVLRVVDDLVNEGLVIASDDKERGGGRPGELLRFNGDAYAMIGIDLGYPNMLGTVADLCGNIYFQHSIPIKLHDGSENLKRLFQLIELLVKTPQLEGKSFKGIGIGVPGFVDQERKLVKHSRPLGWDNLLLSDLVRQKYNMPVLLDTDVNLIMLGEAGFGLGHSANSLVCFTLGTRILSAIYLNGELVRGSSHSAGQLGFSLPGLEFLNSPYDEVGALDSVACGNSLVEIAREQSKNQSQVSAGQNLDAISIYTAAEKGERWAVPIIEKVIDYLAITIANISVFLDPEMILISGRVSGAAGFLPPLIQKRLSGKIPVMPNICVSNLGTRATVMGAIMLIYKGVLHQNGF